MTIAGLLGTLLGGILAINGLGSLGNIGGVDGGNNYPSIEFPPSFPGKDRAIPAPGFWLRYDKLDLSGLDDDCGCDGYEPIVPILG